MITQVSLAAQGEAIGFQPYIATLSDDVQFMSELSSRLARIAPIRHAFISSFP
jgi:hypothetical protein